MLAVGSMGAGGIGGSLAYQQSANFTFTAGGAPFLIDLISNASLGTGFDSATFKVSDNGNLIINRSFANLFSAQAFFSNNNLLAIQLSYRQILVTAEPVRRRRLWADGRST
jgi:hypothetical protein